MSKSDFEFYQIAGIDDDEFVIPKPDSDPYRGVVSPVGAGEVAIGHIVRAVGENIGNEQLKIHVDPITPEGYFFNQTPEGTAVVAHRVAITVGLEASSDYYSKPMNLMARWLGSKAGVSLMPEQAAEITDRPPVQLRAFRGFVEDFTALYDNEEQPTDPTILARQIIPIRAFQWLPGPVRESPTRGQLDPVFSPRPVAVAIAQLIEITGRNPHAHNKEGE